MQLSDSNSSSTSSVSESENDELVEHSGHCDPSQMSQTLTPGDSPQHPRGEPSHVQPSGSSSCSSESTLHPSVSSGDFGKVVELKAERKLTNHEKQILLANHFVPPRKYKFPARFVGGRIRHFQHSWLEQHNGLVYSESEDGGYCKHCVLFASDGPTMKLGVLVNKPLVDFKRATEKLSEHFHGKKFHKASLEAATRFNTVMKNPELAVDHRLCAERSKRAAKNHLKLLSIAETVIFCGRQGLAFRGHRDDSPSSKEDSCGNHGNFLALLHFRAQAGDKVLQEHLSTAPANALYTSKTIQNEMIAVCGGIIRRKLVEMVQRARFFSVIADEATDVANDEQLSICVRFVDGGSPHEKFLAFHECQSGVTGEAIADAILTKLVEWQLQPQLLCGQAYDGAGAMAGKSKGVASRILSKYPKALYTHCAAHRLNLCVVKCCSIREVSNMMHTVQKVSRFFGSSPKRQLALEGWINDVLAEENRKKLKDVCRTRWVERHEAFEVFSDLFLPTFCCLEAIVYSAPSSWNRETRSDAQSLLLAISQFPFLVALLITQKVLGYTKGLSKKLQGHYVDIVRAHKDTESVKTVIRGVRSRVDHFHSQVYKDVLMLSQSIDVVEMAPRQANRQQHRQNIPAENISEYYKRNLTIPVLDHLSYELDTRFDADGSRNLIEFMQLLPVEVVKTTSHLRPENFSSLIQVYGNELPSVKSIDVELDLWQNKWNGDIEHAQELNTPEKVLAHTDYDYFPNIHTLLVIMATLPVTSCECERSISMLKLVKTALRSSMTENRLNDLAMLLYHRDIPVTAEEVVQEFVCRHPRRLLMENPFTD